MGIMTLPNAVLFPGTLLPLYIFEARYRRMLTECLQGDRLFAVGLSRPDQGEEDVEPCDVAGVGLIRTAIGNPDGTSHLVLQGLSRVRIVEFFATPPDLPYPLARIEALESTGQANASQREPVVGAVKRLTRVRARLGVKLPPSVIDSLMAVESPGLFADVVSNTFLESYQDKQRLLETLDINERLERLEELLAKQISQFELWKQLQGKLPNKHVGQN